MIWLTLFIEHKISIAKLDAKAIITHHIDSILETKMRLTDLKSLNAFMTVVELGSFTQAAEKLHLTRSAVSKMVAKLEQQMGAVLLTRNTRHVTLTDEGAVFYEYSQRAVQELLTAENLLDSSSQHIRGSLRLSMPVLFGQKFIVPILKTLSEQHPELNIELSFNDRRVDLIEDNFDLAIRIGHLEDSSQLIAKKIGQHAMWLCATPHYLEQHGTPSSLTDLEQQHLIRYAKSGQMQAWQFKDPNLKTIKYRPNGNIQMDDMQAILDYTLMGGGISWLPSWLIQPYLQSGRLKHLLADHSSNDYPIQIVWKQSHFLPLRIRITIDLIAQSLQQHLTDA